MLQKASNAKTLVVALATMLLAACLFVFAGCSQQFAIGTQSSDATEVSVKNETGQAITSVAVKSALAEGYPEALAQEGDWQNDETADVYVPGEVVSVETETIAEGEDGTIAEQDDLVLEPRCDIRFTTADGMTYELHQLNVEDIEDAHLSLEGETAYLVYTSAATGEEVSTLEAELAYQEQIKAEAEAKAQAEQEAAEQAKKEQEEKEQAEKNKAANTNKKPSSSPSEPARTEKPSNDNDTSNASSGEDNCVDDLIFN